VDKKTEFAMGLTKPWVAVGKRKREESEHSRAALSHCFSDSQENHYRCGGRSGSKKNHL
jgi:hypothetical protein